MALSQVHKEGRRRRKSGLRGLSRPLKSECDKICMEPKDLGENMDRRSNSVLVRLWMDLNCNNSLPKREKGKRMTEKDENTKFGSLVCMGNDV